MLLKWLLLAIIAWYVYRAGRNLVRAALGQSDEPLPGPGPGVHRARSGRDQDDTIRVHVNQAASPSRPSASRPPSRAADDQVEDARFEDL